MDYGVDSRTGKLVSYHMFEYTGQVSLCVYSCAFVSALLSDCVSSQQYLYVHILFMCSSVCVILHFEVFINFVYE